MKGKTKDLTDEELHQLLEKAKASDNRALGKFCEHFYSKIYRFIYYRVNSIEDAEDLTSEVCLRVVKSLHEQKGSFYAWIFRIAANMTTDYYRRRAVRSNVKSTGDLIEEMVDEKRTINELLEQQELRQALKHLTEEQQQVIVLKFIEGYDTNEIANLVGKSAGAVRATQFRALTVLRNLFASDR
ncbi:MAG: sigma-70 family RNA polymerase sigma factor [Bacteroidetes bacterium]|nr:sigma-70 family RNA polymerase sigma factor [Bacteroidota bacterium]MBU1680745.1 sigma-70 family RNA polymerase sigma factor [Bacteroidota bacterium]